MNSGSYTHLIYDEETPKTYDEEKIGSSTSGGKTG
jgi:hypothetical protein